MPLLPSLGCKREALTIPPQLLFRRSTCRKCQGAAECPALDPPLAVSCHIPQHVRKVCFICSVMRVEKAGGRERAGARQTAERRDGDPLNGGYKEYYLRDAQGTIMATYKYADNGTSLKVTDRPVYGSSRIGSFTRQMELMGEPAMHQWPYTQPMQAPLKRYELTDHLGNVAAVVTGRLLPGNGSGASKQAELISAQGYEAFGSLLPGRNYNSASSSHLFQGQLHDDEIYGSTGTNYAFEYRMHDPRAGRFWSVDPLAFLFPWNSPYAFSENRVLDMVELEGLEAAPTEDKRPMDPGAIDKVEDWSITKQRPSNFMADDDAPSAPSAPSASQAPPSPKHSGGATSGQSRASSSFSNTPPSGKNYFAGDQLAPFGFNAAWSSVESFINKVKPPDPFDWFAGGLEYNLGSILKDRAKYGRISNPVIVKTPLLNVSTSAKILRSAGSVLRFAGGAAAFMGAVDISSRWRSGQISTGRALLEGTITGAGFFGPIGLGVSIVGSVGVSAYDRYTEKGCIICWDGF